MARFDDELNLSRDFADGAGGYETVSRSRAPAVLNAFEDERAPIPSSAPMRAVVAAFHGGRARWALGDGRRTPYFAFEEPSSSTVISLQPPSNAAGCGVDVGAALNGQLDVMNDLAVDVLLAALAQWMGPHNRERDGTCWVSAAAILDYRGIAQKTVRKAGVLQRAGHRSADIAAIARCWSAISLVFVQLLRIQVVEADGPSPKARRKTTTLHLESPVLLTTHRVTSRRAGGDLPIAWRFKPGDCFLPFLQFPNIQTTILMQQVLRYHPYRELWAKRLAIYAMFHLRMAGRTRPILRRIDEILDETSLQIDRDNPKRTRKNFEEGLDQLGRDGLIGDWRYDRLRQLPRFDWLDAWKRLTIAIDPPLDRQQRQLSDVRELPLSRRDV